jgi:hypothetical protein
MNNIIQIYSSIKKEQKPINQFLEIEKESIIFNNFKRYKNSKKSLLIILLLIFVYFLCIKNLFYLFNFFLIFFFFINFFIWDNLYANFQLSEIYYEESSWFDTKIWQKPIFLIKNDKIFSNYKSKEKSRALFKSILFFLALIFF